MEIRLKRNLMGRSSGDCLARVQLEPEVSLSQLVDAVRHNFAGPVEPVVPSNPVIESELEPETDSDAEE